jgi:tripartite-type tricarboxylate transporter receptor subunit TctC
MLPHLRSGKLRGLGTGGAKRNSAVPELPTLDEAGVKGYEGSNWWGIMVPAGTPQAIVNTLDKEISGVLAREDVRQRFTVMGAEAEHRSQDGLARLIADETAKWTKVAKQARIQAQ